MADSMINLEDPEENNSGFDPSVSLEHPSLSSRNQTSTPTSSSSRGDTSVSLEHPSSSNRSPTTTPTSSSSRSSSGKGKSNRSSDSLQREIIEMMRSDGKVIKKLHEDIDSGETGIDKADRQFLDSIGIAMNNLPPLIKRRLQIKIQTALLEAETEAQDHACSSSAHSSTLHSCPTDRDSSQRTNNRVENDESPQF